jgi:hypothetical protein
MQLNYIKLSKDLYKLFLDEKDYGEFYGKLNQKNTFKNGIVLEPKDPEYANALALSFHKAMTSTCASCEAHRDNKANYFCPDHDIIKYPKGHKEESKRREETH